MPRQTTIEHILEFAGGLDGIDVYVLRQGLQIASLHRQGEQVVENDLAGWGLTARQIEIMESLFHNLDGTMTPADLADEVSLSRSAMTSTLDCLEKLGHVVRAPHPTDRRMIAISLTAEGREFIRGRLPERYQRFCRVMGSLSANERAVMLRAHRKIIHFLAQNLAEAGKQS